MRVGRNLANFQTLEHILKELIPTLQVRGTVDEIARNLKSSRKEVKKSGLGDLSEVFHSSVFKAPVDEKPPDEVTEPVFSFTMSIDAPPDWVKATKAKWRKLVTQRNKLVHSQLMEYDFSVSEDCARLCEILDAQNLEICAMLDELARLRSSRAFAVAAFVEQSEKGNLFEFETTQNGA